MILLTGASGQVGTALEPLLAAHDEVASPDLDVLDMEDPASLDDVLEGVAPDVIVNAGAWTAVDAAEDHEDRATVINGRAVAVMSQWAAANDAWMVTLSTDYVFDGTGDRPLLEDHPTDPINAYGRSKVVGERAALASGVALVVRTSWVVSATHPNFVRTMLSLLQRGVDPKVVDDQVGCPTIATDLAATLARLVRDRPTGLLHVTNSGQTTWFEFARAAAGLAGMDADRISPCPSSAYPTPAARPGWSVLGTGRAAELGLEPLPWWRASLPDVVAGQLATLAR